MICETIQKLLLNGTHSMLHGSWNMPSEEGAAFEDALIYATQTLLVILCTTVRLACTEGAGLWLD